MQDFLQFEKTVGFIDKNSGKQNACRCKIWFRSIRRADQSDQSSEPNGLILPPAFQKELAVSFADRHYLWVEVERRVTSWAPPSTMETEETRVSLASSCRSGMLVTPTLHMVDLTLYMEASTLSCREPA